MSEIFGALGIFIIALTLRVRAEPDQICPMNEAILVGQNIELHFETVKPFYFVNWLEYTDSVNGRTVFLNGTNVFSDKSRAERFELTHRVGNATENDTSVYHTFHVYDCTLADAGRYCALEFIDSVFHWAEVIVLERDIECLWGNQNAAVSDQIFTADDVINVTCTIPFRGRWAPRFSCAGVNFDNFTSVNLTREGLASYSFAGRPRMGNPGGSVTCDAYFANPTPQEYVHGHARNVPSYHSSWQSPTLRIYYPPSEMTVSPVLLSYDVGDAVRCLAKGGNPAPAYRWLSADDNDTLSTTPVLLFTADMAATTVDAVCVAETTIRGTVHELIANASFRVNELPSTTPPMNTSPDTTTKQGGQTGGDGSDNIDNAVLIIIIVSVIAGLLAIALIVVITLLCVKRVTKDDDERI